MEKENITDIIHFAGLKSVAESVAKPDLYFDNNINSTKVILKLMKEYGTNNFVFSSSATVYGNAKNVPFKEDYKNQTKEYFNYEKIEIQDPFNLFSKISFKIRSFKYLETLSTQLILFINTWILFIKCSCTRLFEFFRTVDISLIFTFPCCISICFPIHFRKYLIYTFFFYIYICNKRG